MLTVLHATERDPPKDPQPIDWKLVNDLPVRSRTEALTNECGPVISHVHASRGVAVGDFDNDGDLDIPIMNVNETPSLLRNDASPENHWDQDQTDWHDLPSQRNRGARRRTL